MFSYEIKQFLTERDNTVDKGEYYLLTDHTVNPQINSIKYNSYDDTYEMSTNDGCYFKFRVRR